MSQGEVIGLHIETPNTWQKLHEHLGKPIKIQQHPFDI